MSGHPSRRVRALVATCAATGILASCASAEPSIKPTGDAAQSKAAFMEMAEVLTHPRCLNCHAGGDNPTRGDAMVPHEPPVVRGTTGMGAVGMRCSTCHGEANTLLAEHAGTLPGAPTWRLAPASLAWQGKSAGQICEQLKGLAQSGEVSLEQIVERNGIDPLTGWAWNPGEGRTPAPGSQAEFGKQTRAWVDSGAHCPDS